MLGYEGRRYGQVYDAVRRVQIVCVLVIGVIEVREIMATGELIQ